MKKVLAWTLLSSAAAAQTTTLEAAGATLPYPLYSKMFSEYHKLTGVTVSYLPVGSGEGRSQLLERQVDFAGTDSPMTDEALKGAPGKILHVPTAIGSVVPAYNLPSVSVPLKFTGRLLADIYLGKIKTWNDPAIAALNPGVTLPPLPIATVHRSDSSGTTAIFTRFLTQTSSEWKAKIGEGSRVQWVGGQPGRGNEGVANLVRSTPGTLGYLELGLTRSNKLSYGSVQNRAGRFIQADPRSAGAAAQAVPLPAHTRVNIVNSPNAEAYPLASFTYLVFYQDQAYAGRSLAQAQALKQLLIWITGEAQTYHEALGYAKLPAAMQTKVKAVLNSMTFGNKKL